ncbi:malonyl-coenzyme:anthocyanin 5-O-glucoside-6 -O-malonyltransferase-like [Olea europaea subsp. europaea]|uniref:Malonyl-coenzyme:anthocyanin 5-O-glucoside-6 -O-malonyltransferase-like n=1 Tax=Olea europaea subsp. europaea TaxID=158383 RepID=A0A8S0SJF2_OLEEU|nr:malonyl-coenzyme:anthocyanin 5-O-glucoside-6 -O-malonyltransferase-like [Olea europaea subsp. europaea]
MATQIEHCEIQPPPGEVNELTLPLTFFDLPWLYFHPIQRLLFYEFPCSEAYFFETIVPNLKESLSLTLEHYIPLAGNLLCPLNNEKPVLRYMVEDSVPLIIAESNENFNNLTANYARDTDQFYPFVPQLPRPKKEAEYKIIRVFSLQVTLFPNHGLCIGFTNLHTVGDASSIVGFIKAWASISKLGGDSQLIETNSLPLFDRSVIQDPNGIGNLWWNQLNNIPIRFSSLHSLTNKVRNTYILHQADIQKLKDSLFARNPEQCGIIAPPVERLLFYEFPCSKVHFLEAIVPDLKKSLSLTLKYYYPLAGNLLYPLSTGKPVFRYLVGDSVSLTVAKSEDDFSILIANHARDADQFYPFVPQLPPPKEETEYKTIPVLSLRVTLVQNRGLSIGFTNHHNIGDNSSVVGFIKAWASINKLSGNSQSNEAKLYPLFDRSVIKDSRGIGDIWWNQLKNVNFQHSSLCLPTNKVWATYVLSQADIQKLKELLLARKPGVIHPSSFVVTTAYVWTCLVKSGPPTGEEVNADTPECFTIAANLRARIDPLVLANYFGNCIGGGLAEIKRQELMENEAYFIAAKAIAEVIRVKVNNKEEVLEDPENWLEGARKLVGKRVLSVSGSPKFNLYSSDYGWGRPKKLEVVSIDRDNAISLCYFI